MTRADTAAQAEGIADLSLQQLLDLLDLETTADGTAGADVFVGRPQPHPSDRVFGGLLLAQAMAAAGRTAPAGHRPLGLQAEFLRGVPTGIALCWHVDRVADGPSMTVRRMTLRDRDGGELFTATSRWGVQREDLTTYSSTRPRPATPPEDLPGLEDRFGGDGRVPMWWRMRRPVHFRHAEPPPYTEPVLPERESQSVWVRARGRLPGDAALEAAVLAYVSDMSILEPVFRARRSARHAPGSRILSLSHSLTFHAPAHLSDWHQLDSACSTVAQGRALGMGDFFDREGRHVASVSQLALVKLA
jgi:acyl-CoA thioesterase II